MAVITISSEKEEGPAHETASITSQRLGFLLVDSTLIGSKLNNRQGIDGEGLIKRVLRGEVPPKLVKRLMVEEALDSNVIILNLGGEILFHGFPGTLHVKIHLPSDKKKPHGSARERERNQRRFIHELYGKERPGSNYYDLQVKLEHMDTDFAVNLILKAVEIKGITDKAGITWKALKKLKTNLERLDSAAGVNDEFEHPGVPTFAHPSERDFARVLDFYRIKWQYEPRSFPIEWDEEGNVKEEFTPDFYLPDLDLYIELTTLRQKLVTKKNRKIRRVKELYPNIDIKIFYGKDYKRLLQRFGIK
ncbi:MAG TPA: hypothetical protein VNN20_05385 [Thermodesulfobacteriota bacterium]|nr:hypothetical protein [Thermodesulfobacteriota bacterium]